MIRLSLYMEFGKEYANGQYYVNNRGEIEGSPFGIGQDEPFWAGKHFLAFFVGNPFHFVPGFQFGVYQEEDFAD